MTPQEVQERLKLNQLKDKIWNVVPSCATTGEGLFEGLVSRGCLESILDCCLCGLGLALEQCQNCTSKTVKIGHFFARNTISYFLFFSSINDTTVQYLLCWGWGSHTACSSSLPGVLIPVLYSYLLAASKGSEASRLICDSICTSPCADRI